MDPLTIGLGIAGLGMQLFGGLSSAENSKEQAKVSSQIIGNEQQINEQKRTQMNLEAQRQTLEMFRQAQRSQALATSSATSQNAQFGSGLQGGLGEIESQTLSNVYGVNANREIGQNIFDITGKISGEKQQLSALGGQQATNAGIMSLGGALVKNAGTIGGFGKNLMAGFGTNPGGPYV